MLAQNEDFIDAFTSMGKHLKLRVTNKCNLKCRHCYSPTEDYNAEKDQINIEHVERCIKSKYIEYIHIMGGEPTLYPEKMKACSEISHKYNKPCCIFTNGLLLHQDKNMIKYIKEEVKPDMICVSLNKYLLEQVPQYDIVNELSDIFLDSPIKFFSTAMIDKDHLPAMTRFLENGGWPPYDPSYFQEMENQLKHQFFKFQLILTSGGRAETLEDVPKVKWPMGIVACDFSVALHPDGILSADCGAGDPEVDTLGHIDEFGSDPVDNIMLRRSICNRIHDTKGEYNSFYDVCKKDRRFTCLRK